MRYFKSGASRNDNKDKYDFEGFLSPIVLEAYAKYMHKNRLQADGKLRASDNWQKGMPKDAYMKSSFRHFMDVWLFHRGFGKITKERIVESLCALFFNIQGYLFEILKEKK